MKRTLKTGDIFYVTEPGLKLCPRALYVVTETDFTGGGTGHGANDIYPDGHEVTASKLKNNKFNPKARPVRFYQTGCFCNMVEPDKVTLAGIGKKKTTTTFSLTFVNI